MFKVYPLANHYPPFHGFRVFAIFLVLQLHNTSIFYELNLIDSVPPLMRLFSLRSFYSMDAFFFISGFLIGGILLKKRKSLSFSYFKSFYMRRGLRILPLYYFVLTALAVSYSLKFGLTDFQISNLWKEYLYLTNYPYNVNHIMFWSWSLSVEEHFYIGFPLLFLLFNQFKNKKTLAWFLVTIFFSGAAVRYFELKSGIEAGRMSEALKVIFHATHCNYDLFAAGFFTVFVQQNYDQKLKKLMENKLIRWSLCLVPLSILGAISWPFDLTMDPLVPKSYFTLAGIPGLDLNTAYAICNGTLPGISFTLFSFYILNSKGRINSFLSKSIFSHLSSLGYGVYLVHFPVIFFVNMPLVIYILPQLGGIMSWIVSLVVLTTVSLLIAYAIHMLVEKPILEYRDRKFC